VHLQEGFDFLGFHIKWRRKRGTDKCFVYTFIADKPVREFKRKIRALTHRRSQVGLGAALTRINQIQRGWANYFKHAVAKHTFDRLRESHCSHTVMADATVSCFPSAWCPVVRLFCCSSPSRSPSTPVRSSPPPEGARPQPVTRDGFSAPASDAWLALSGSPAGAASRRWTTRGRG